MWYHTVSLSADVLEELASIIIMVVYVSTRLFHVTSLKTVMFKWEKFNKLHNVSHIHCGFSTFNIRFHVERRKHKAQIAYRFFE